MSAHRGLASVVLSTGVAPDALLAHPELLEELVELIQEAAGRG